MTKHAADIKSWENEGGNLALRLAATSMQPSCPADGTPSAGVPHGPCRTNFQLDEKVDPMKRMLKPLLLGIISVAAGSAAADRITFYPDDNFAAGSSPPISRCRTFARNGFNDRVQLGRSCTRPLGDLRRCRIPRRMRHSRPGRLSQSRRVRQSHQFRCVRSMDGIPTTRPAD